MGTMLNYRCKNPECDFSLDFSDGIGMLYPVHYQKTVEEMKKGKMGKVLKDFFDEHPDGAVNIENAIVQCSKCKKCEVRKNLTMYIPDPKIKKKKKAELKDYVSISYPDDDDYIEYAKYPHKCGYCGGEMNIIDRENFKICPICGAGLIEEEVGFWD